MQNRSIAFIGAGNMTTSIISGLISSGYCAQNIWASNRSAEKLTNLKNQFSINTTQDNDTAIAAADVVVLAVKPQGMQEMLEAVKLPKVQLENKLFISIAAGIPLQRLNQMLGFPAKIIRTMPNTPSLLGLGLTGIYAPDNISTEDKTYTESLMSAVGKSIWVDSEEGIDKIIGVAGSAPAYFFLFMECIAKEAEQLGFSPVQAREIVQQVALGSASMVCKNASTEIATLRENVTSKGGTTAAALASFNDSKLDEITHKAIQAAIARSREMAKLF
ncbi:pyrroline-5-carboxylate reductase [Catenovulum sediminis]|uniref:Pyrroline-5-carboxylate reductase n=1 Tax=Catenovulum sediminis TaxID=1740262 RepID=A0ABV1RL12_9ALTE|nr:pyrroline-5-carboxylate reductase [Catenovulum sediminis]